MSTFADRNFSRRGRLVLGLLLLALPACGLSSYEELMREAQQREERFRTEQKYLDEPVQMPTRQDSKGQAVPIANVFFRPPKGIGAKPDADQAVEGLWHYRASANGGDFIRVDMMFNTDNTDGSEFINKVFGNYGREEDPKTPKRDPPLPFDSWEFDGTESGYSINVSKGGRPQVAVVFVFGKGRRDALRTPMDLSLQSLAVEQQVLEARQKYNKKSPWRLKP